MVVLSGGKEKGIYKIQNDATRIVTGVTKRVSLTDLYSKIVGSFWKQGSVQLKNIQPKASNFKYKHHAIN